VAVAEAARGLSAAQIRAALAKVRVAHASAARFVPNATASAGLTGHTLAGTGAPSTDAALTLLCSLLAA
jgi:hypothetical protein